jgi:hypothetical protein
MLSAQDSVPALGLSSLGPWALWSAVLSAQSGEGRFGDRRIVLAPAGLITSFTAIAGTTPVGGTIIKLTRSEAQWIAATEIEDR